MNRFFLTGRSLALLAVLIPLLLLFIYVGLRSGPLAPVAVTTAQVESRAISPSLFGIGTVEARYTYKIGPTSAGRLQQLTVQVGDRVAAGQRLGEMSPVDINDRIRAQRAVVKRAQAGLLESQARQQHAQAQLHRYQQLFTSQLASEETITVKRQEYAIADAALEAAGEELARSFAELDAVEAQRNNLQLTSPADGLVISRELDPGSTVVAGQSVVEVIDPTSLWVNVRFDQISASGLVAGLPATITLRSRQGEPALQGRVLRLEPKADAVTEELLAKIVFDHLPEPLPAIAELAEVTVTLPARPHTATLPNAAIRIYQGTTGVWKLNAAGKQFVPIQLGAADLNGRVEVKHGLQVGDSVVVYSESALAAHSRIQVVKTLP